MLEPPVRGLHAYRGGRRPIAQKRRREHKLSPKKLWQSAVGKHTSHHSCKSSSGGLGHTDFLRGVGAGVLERHPRLKAIVLELLADELAAFVNPQTLDAETA